ncbi:transcriptional regulator [Gordonia sp. VNK21]|uniref:transcriptional regulator n=1 Tax=Gordonia sp. VNK21 TaxID=3382483 RepID=UPI0038D3C2BB
MQNQPGHTTRRHRPAMLILAIVGALVCLGMAWWQWDRYESASGTFQNLGYALQWPVFAVAMVWAYRRFVVLESTPEPERVRTGAGSGPREIPAGVLPDRPAPGDLSIAALAHDDPDPQLAEYNRYLAELDTPAQKPAARSPAAQKSTAPDPSTPQTRAREEEAQ